MSADGKPPMREGVKWGHALCNRRRGRWVDGRMNLLLVLLICLLLFGGGGFYIGGPVYGGSAVGLILLICLILALSGSFRRR